MKVSSIGIEIMVRNIGCLFRQRNIAKKGVVGSRGKEDCGTRSLIN